MEWYEAAFELSAPSTSAADPEGTGAPHEPAAAAAAAAG